MSAPSNGSTPLKVVILGGGFAGLRAARVLARGPVEVTVVDRRNHHLFQPLLYQVATAALNPSDIAHPIRAVLRSRRNVQTLLGEARDIDLEDKRVLLRDGGLTYDRLIVATGATHSYFGNDDWEEHAPGLKTIEDALEIRRRVLLAFEAAEREPERQSEWLTFVVVGAGPTGVELAGALAEISRHALRRDFRRITPQQARILLVEGSDRVLPPYPADLSQSARDQLESLGVEVLTGRMVAKIDAAGVELKDGERIDSHTVLWAAGVQGSPLGAKLGAPTDRAGRVRVEPDLSVPGHPDVFVVGDLASIDQAVDDKGESRPVPGVAPAALQAGEHVARLILDELRGRPRRPFRYRDKGSLATIGWARAVADLGRVKFSGLTAWLAWMLIHVVFLIGFRNRFFVLLGWAWSYVTFRRGARLITGPTADLYEKPAVAQEPTKSDSPRESDVRPVS